MSEDPAWWKEATVYQIYPRSFNDSNGDGIGDIPGIIEKVDYVEALGVDAVWLSPVYASPNVDNGYDVSDYRAIMDEFGTMADWERLVEELHDRDIRLIMDMVINHTSDEHEWFVKARESPDSEYRGYYYWRGDSAAGGGPANNWESVWGGPAWTRDEATGEHYLHLFHEKQAELNWRNPAVRDEIASVVEWWLERGVDGFRLDSINLISKPEGLPDGDPDGELRGLNLVANGPLVDEYLRELCGRPMDEDTVTIGEMPELTVEEASRYVGETGDLSMLFSFEHVEIDRGEGARWTSREWELPELKETIERWQVGLEGQGWLGLYFNNHDQPRAVSRFGDDGDYRRESATLLATLLLTLRGTPFIYQGEEIGMTNPHFDSLDDIRDVATRRSVEHAIEEGEISGFEEVKDLVNRRTRDNARTPMQWCDDEGAGFTDGDPWIAVNDDYEDVNVEAARGDPDSVWHQYRRLIDLRAEHPTLVYGSFELLYPEHPDLFCYRRSDDDGQYLILLNLSEATPRVDRPDGFAGEGADLLFANRSVEDRSGSGLELRPYEARVYRLA